HFTTEETFGPCGSDILRTVPRLCGNLYTQIIQKTQRGFVDIGSAQSLLSETSFLTSTPGFGDVRQLFSLGVSAMSLAACARAAGLYYKYNKITRASKFSARMKLDETAVFTMSEEHLKLHRELSNKCAKLSADQREKRLLASENNTVNSQLRSPRSLNSAVILRTDKYICQLEEYKKDMRARKSIKSSRPMFLESSRDNRRSSNQIAGTLARKSIVDGLRHKVVDVDNMADDLDESSLDN
ncbi:hypothetical protein PROFUN_16953, partial [Planoprotostelium fungivorum]